MSRTTARVCPHCGALNSRDEPRCFRCAARLPGPLGMALLRGSRSLLGRDYPVTRGLVAVCAAIYVLMTLEQGRLLVLGGHPGVAQAWGALAIVPGTLQPLRYLSAGFVHYGLLHIGLNSMMLLSFGRSIEEQFGGYRAAVVFLGTGFLGFFASDLYYGAFAGTPTHTAGASAGVAGLIGATIGVAFALRNAVWKRALGTLLVYAVVFALIMPGQINHMAHAGGFGGGWLLGMAFVRERRRRRDVRYRRAAWGLALLTVLSIVAARIA
jgi:rhomboid protease GluP